MGVLRARFLNQLAEQDDESMSRPLRLILKYLIRVQLCRTPLFQYKRMQFCQEDFDICRSQLCSRMRQEGELQTYSV